jgi:hypothetical protein
MHLYLFERPCMRILRALSSLDIGILVFIRSGLVVVSITYFVYALV